MKFKPKRILHTFKVMDRGGAETLIMNIYRHINRDEVQFDFAVHSDKPGNYDDEIRSLGGRIFQLSSPQKGIGAYTRSLRNILRNHGPFTGVHSHLLFFSGIVLHTAKKEGIPIRIAHSHSTGDGHVLKLKRRTYHYIMKKLIDSDATHKFGCSKEACEYLFGQRCWNDSRIKIIRNAIDLKSFERVSKKSRDQIRKSLSLPIEAPIIGHVGRFDKVKNHSFIIEVFDKLNQQMPNVRLVLVGNGPEKEGIETLVKERRLRNKVHFFGVRPDVPEIMTALDLFLFPSLHEGMPLVLVEAQASGLPCVISDTITEEADLGLALINYCSLNSSLDKWLKYILVAIKKKRPNWDLRYQAIKKMGYDIENLSKILLETYKYRGQPND